MTSISSLGSSAWSMASQASTRQPPKLSEKLQADFDADGSGALDATELQSLVDDMASRTGQSGSRSAQDLLSANDSDGNGSLSTAELESALSSMRPAPSTLDFAQGRGAGAEDDLFGKMDSDGSGSLSQDELTAMLQQMQGQGTSANSASGTSSDDAQALFSALDSDGDGALSQSEFDAGRPQAGAGMPPPPPAQEASATASASASSSTTTSASGAAAPATAGGSSTTVYDELDTNEDGVVSVAERLAGAAEASDSQGQSLVEQRQDSSPAWAQSARDALMATASRAYQAASGQFESARSSIRYAA
ncbi:UNVERIFIED_ORG: Ca2+-binding EF-hand superfamily protein [Comamonas terrigena]